MDVREGFQVFFLFVLIHKSQLSVISKPMTSPRLLLVSIDGFRWDYLTRTQTPNMDRVIKNGVHVTEGVSNVFTTSTLTNHWSMVTGLYSESHGIVENTMLDPEIGMINVPLYENRFATSDPRLYDVPGVEPIWATNQLQKKHGRSGSVMWWGAENAVKGVRPTYHMPYHMYGDDVFKIKTLVGWYVNDNPINLGLLYFPEPDTTAHEFGPESVQVTQKIARTDELMGILLHEIEKANLLEDLNIIITADHGFTTLSKERLINLDSFIDPSWYTLVHDTPVATITPHQGFEDKIYKKLKEAAPTNHFKVFKKSEIPERLHYKHNSRVTPIIAIADLSWSFISQMSPDNFTKVGDHGYDNNHKEMRPFFMAMGPSFKQGYTMDTFNGIDIYALMCHLLDLKPNPNNGTLATVSQLLTKTDASLRGGTAITDEL